MASNKLNKTDNRWSEEIMEEILELIIKRLPLVDRLRFKAVCQVWRRVMTERRLLPLSELPWLMFSSSPSSKSLNFLNLSGENRVYRIKVPEVCRRSWCCGSSEGWLIMADEREGNFLFNPLSRSVIALPHQATIPHSTVFRTDILNPRFLRKAILSCAPTIDINCVVVAIDGFGNLCYCRIGDKSWTELEHGLSIYDDIVFYKGQLHAITYREELKVFSSVAPNSKVILNEKLLHVGNDPRDTLLYLHGQLSGTIYLVESDSKLLVVVRQGFPVSSYQFKVYEVDHSGKHLFQVKSLRDQMLFVGKNCCLSFKATSDYYLGAGGNCIYFTDNAVSGVYRMEDQITDCGLPHNSPSGVSQHVWFTPNPSYDSDN